MIKLSRSTTGDDDEGGPMSDHWTTDTGATGADVEFHDTIALLHEEIARLEEELRLRDDGPEEVAATLPIGLPADETAGPRIEALTTDLAIRDETIDLLVEQVRLLEEASAADRDEWEQLHRWVQEVERRVEGRDQQGDDLSLEVEALRREAEARHQAVADERRGWNVQRKGLEEEGKDLRKRLAEAAGPAGGGARVRGPPGGEPPAPSDLPGAGAGLFRRGRVRPAGPATPLDPDRARRGQARGAPAHRRSRTREIEHEAALASLRSQLSRDSLKRPEGEEEEPSPDDRIRALRAHLNEIHSKEQDERSNRRLSARLSRLWNRSGPNG
jgi:hypothetical protein